MGETKGGEVTKTKLTPCPFCEALPVYHDDGDYAVFHMRDCYLRGYVPEYVFSSEVKAWDRRAGAKEEK